MNEILQLLIDRLNTPIGQMLIVATEMESCVLSIGQTTNHVCMPCYDVSMARMASASNRHVIQIT